MDDTQSVWGVSAWVYVNENYVTGSDDFVAYNLAVIRPEYRDLFNHYPPEWLEVGIFQTMWGFVAYYATDSNGTFAGYVEKDFASFPLTPFGYVVYLAITETGNTETWTAQWNDSIVKSWHFDTQTDRSFTVGLESTNPQNSGQGHVWGLDEAYGNVWASGWDVTWITMDSPYYVLIVDNSEFRVGPPSPFQPPPPIDIHLPPGPSDNAGGGSMGGQVPKAA